MFYESASLSLETTKISYTLKMFYLLCLSLITFLTQVDGHGRLIEPPARSSAWRFGFNTPINYNDNELFCGGFNVQWSHNKGKCGVCGDAYNGRRDHELPNGKYTKNLVVTRTYFEGDVIDVKVQLTANHRGFFVFKICPAPNNQKEVSQNCLDKFPLTLLKKSYKYYVTSNDPAIFATKLRLPKNLTCSRCVLQWTYTAGNNWGQCEDKSFKVGCGPQETFRGCADVKIMSRTSAANKSTEQPHFETTAKTRTTKVFTSTKKPTFKNKQNQDEKPFQTTSVSIGYDQSTSEAKNCHSKEIWKSIGTMDLWCQQNCARGFCPASHCDCN